MERGRVRRWREGKKYRKRGRQEEKSKVEGERREGEAESPEP